MAVLRRTRAVAALGLTLAASAASSQTSNGPSKSYPATNHTVTPAPFQGEGKARPPVSDWRLEQQRRDRELADYLARKPVAYRWFADFPFGVSSGVPYIILRLLPKIAPQEWGSKENFLDVVGLFKDEREPNFPIARGFGWTGLARDDPFGAVDFAALSCGSCHIGRVRLDDGSLRYIDGGVNSQFNLVQYRVRVINTIKAMTEGAATPEEKLERATAAILAVLDKAHAEDRNFFYQDYAFGRRKFDAAYEEKQIQLFRQNAAELVKGFIGRAELELDSFLALLAKNYKGLEGPMTTGFGGMADATGVSSSFVFVARKARGESVDPDTLLPPAPGITDFMAVWEQEKRKVRWNADRTALIDGGGQWNGNIPIPMFRNLAAELTLGLGADTDLRVGAFAVDLLGGLPAPPYPFSVDMALAKKGEALFAENCAGCHKPHNGRVYDLGTDLGRAHVVSQTIAASARASFTKICSPTQTITMPPEGAEIKPCAEFEGVSLADRPQFAMADPTAHEGYNALPLGGVWAQAPYLHNGSVPTLYHLLVPSERPAVFIKGRLDYDRSLVGFSWREERGARQEDGYRFDTTVFPALSNKGHDKNVIEEGNSWKLDWSDDKEGAMAIVEYLKMF
jgi:mono/diheme cytochrome c family protein